MSVLFGLRKIYLFEKQKFDVIQLFLKNYLKQVWQFIISTSNATLEVSSLRPWIGSATKWRSKTSTEEGYGTKLLFGRFIYLLSIDEIEFEDLFGLFSFIPTSLPNEIGEPRYRKSKVSFTEVTERATIINARKFQCCFHWWLEMLPDTVHLSKGKKMVGLIDGVKKFLLKYLHFTDVYLIFNRYYNYNVKSNAWAARVKNFKNGHNLFCQCPLPSKDDTLSFTKFKVHLKQNLHVNLVYIGLTEKNCLVITSTDNCPTELEDREKTSRPDLGTGCEETGNIIIK